MDVPMDSGASPPNDHGAPAYGIPTQSLNNENPQVNGWNGGDDSNGISENPEKLKRSERPRRSKASAHAAPEEEAADEEEAEDDKEAEDEEGEKGEDPTNPDWEADMEPEEDWDDSTELGREANAELEAVCKAVQEEGKAVQNRGKNNFKAGRDEDDFQVIRADDEHEDNRAVESHPAFQNVPRNRQFLARWEFLDVNLGRPASQVQNVRNLPDFEVQAARTKQWIREVLGLAQKRAIADYRVFVDQQHRHEGCLDGTVNFWDDLAAFGFKHNERFERMDLDFYADLCFNRLNDHAKYYWCLPGLTMDTLLAELPALTSYESCFWGVYIDFVKSRSSGEYLGKYASSATGKLGLKQRWTDYDTYHRTQRTPENVAKLCLHERIIANGGVAHLRALTKPGTAYSPGLSNFDELLLELLVSINFRTFDIGDSGEGVRNYMTKGSVEFLNHVYSEIDAAGLGTNLEARPLNRALQSRQIFRLGTKPSHCDDCGRSFSGTTYVDHLVKPIPAHKGRFCKYVCAACKCARRRHGRIRTREDDARRALKDSTRGQEVCPVEECGESTAPGSMSFVLQNGVRICSGCYTGRQQNSAWARNISDEEYVKEMSCRRRLSNIKHCGIEGCGAEIDRTKGGFQILRKAGIVLCSKCTRAKLSKGKWTLGLSEEEFVVERARRLAANKAKTTSQTLCAVEGCGSELGPKNQFWLGNDSVICYKCYMAKRAKRYDGRTDEQFLVERADRLAKAEPKPEAEPNAKPKPAPNANANSQTCCAVEGCEGKLGPASFCFEGDMNICTGCRRAMSTKKWAEGLGEQEFLVERAIRIATGKAKARAKSDNQTKKTVCAVEGCGTELSRRNRHCLKDGTEICHRCHQSKYGKWNEGNSEEEFLVERARFLAAAKTRAEAKSQSRHTREAQKARPTHCVVEGCGSELVPGGLLWLENGIDGICGKCRNAKKAKWNNGNSEEEFLVERARRLAADKAIAGAKSQNN
jgi:hypothetical protein